MPSFYDKLRKNNKLDQYFDKFEKRAVAMYDELIENGKIAMDDPSFGKLSYVESMAEIRYFAMQDVIESMIENLDEDEFEEEEDESFEIRYE